MMPAIDSTSLMSSSLKIPETLLISTTAFAQVSVSTDKAEYAENDFINIYATVPYETVPGNYGDENAGCNMYILDSNQNIVTGESSPTIGAPCGLNYATDVHGEYGLTNHSHIAVINGLIDRILVSKYGTYTAKLVVNKKDGTKETAYTSFDYSFYDKIIGECSTGYESTKTCEFLGKSYEIATGTGCGNQKINVKVIHDNQEESFDIEETADVLLNDGTRLKNKGLPCSANVINFNFEKWSKPSDTAFTINQNEKISAIILLNNKKTIITPIENKIEIETNGVKATVSEGIKIDGEKLYLGNENVQMLPDDVLNQLGEKVESNSMSLSSGKYTVDGIKSARILGIILVKYDISAEIDANTGAVNIIDKPWWTFLAF